MWQMMMMLPPEILRSIFEFDPTYHEYFGRVLHDIRLLTTQRLASDYFDGSSQCHPTYFRFLQRGIWYTATYTEESHNVFNVILYNEQNGTFGRHLHRLR